ncbi:hypothetical protein [Segetibacter koreensis]|uniref:hypothetical protein n=1 Tax=Segetibacter koreensis TaxID=398037 RepID=UPI00036BAB59|nr:hypothetical protein [Segetibacter koreensis]
MNPAQILIAYFISNLVAITFFFISLKWKELARVLFAALFIWAAWTNWTGVRKTPDFYLGFSQYAIGFYRDIINGIFSNYITPIVSFIAVCQLFIGLGLLSRGVIFKIACLGGVIFLVAISPLGIASAFPSGIIWAAGLLVLYKYPFNKNIFHNNWVV